jgi:hypothetical protein
VSCLLTKLKNIIIIIIIIIIILAKNEYLMRHDEVFTHLHYSICKALGIETIGKWYKHMPKPVYEEGDVTVLWNQAVHTDREIKLLKTKKRKHVH